MSASRRGIYVLAIGYLGGVVGTLWDWSEHLLGAVNQAPHALIDLSGLLIVGVLAFTGWSRLSQGLRSAIYLLLAGLAILVFAPFVLMMTAPHSRLMGDYMSFVMTRGALVLEVPFVILAGWAAWHWLGRGQTSAWRLAAALGVVVVATASVWDLYWHQTHPLEMGTSMNMMGLPPHQLILGGFVLGLIGTARGATISGRSARVLPEA